MTLYITLESKIGSTGTVAEDYGGFEITVTDNENFPWREVFLILIDSGFQIWINKDEHARIQIMSKTEVE